MSQSLIKSNHSFVAFLDELFGDENGSQSSKVTLLPVEGILDSLKNKKENWNQVLDRLNTAIEQLEKLTVIRYFLFLIVSVYREQSLLQARLDNSDAPYILPHDKVK